MPTNYPIEKCEDCGTSTLILDREASDLIWVDGSSLTTLSMPQLATLTKAKQIADKARGAGAQDEKDVIIRELMDGFLIAMELLSRIAIYGIDGTGDNDADDVDLERTIEAAHDVACAFPCNLAYSPFVDVQIDVSNALCNILAASEEEEENNGVRIYPTPTTFEA